MTSEFPLRMTATELDLVTEWLAENARTWGLYCWLGECDPASALDPAREFRARVFALSIAGQVSGKRVYVVTFERDGEAVAFKLRFAEAWENAD